MPERPLRVLFIVNHYPPDVNPSGKLMHQLAEGLRERGHMIDVLTTFPHYHSFRIEPGYRGRLLAHEHLPGGRVTRVWAFASGRKERMLHRLANYVSFNVMVTVAASFSRRKHDVVLANSGSFFTGVTSWLLRTLRRVPFIYNVQDIYPDVPVRAGQLTNRTAIRNLERVERFMYRKAAHVTVIARQQRAVLIRKGVPAERVSVIPNFVDTAFIRPLPKDNAISRGLALHDKFVIAHAGNLGFAYDFDSVLAAAADLRERSDIVFLIVGEGVRHAELAARVRDQQLDNVRMLPFQPETDLPLLRAAIDVQLALYAPGAAESSMPSKIYEIMASGRPAIAGAERGTDLCELVESTGCGICIEPADPAQLRAAIERLHADRAHAALLGQRGRTAALQSYSRDAAVENYERLLLSLANIDIDKGNDAAQ